MYPTASAGHSFANLSPPSTARRHATVFPVAAALLLPDLRGDEVEFEVGIADSDVPPAVEAIYLVCQQIEQSSSASSCPTPLYARHRGVC